MNLDALIIGGDSMIGRVLADACAHNGVSCTLTTRRIEKAGERPVLDLMQPSDAWPELPAARTWIIVAAMSRLAQCRDNPSQSERVNVDAVGDIAELARARGIRVVFLSSDKVFNGQTPDRTADAPRVPGSLYGQQNARAEDIVRKTDPRNVVVRLTKVLGVDDPLFSGWAADLRDGKTVTAFSDLTLAPLRATTVAEGLRHVIKSDISGVLQFSGPRDHTYAEAAGVLAAALGRKGDRVNIATAEAAGFSAEERPPYTSLDTQLARTRLGMTFEDMNTLIPALYAADPA